MREPIEVSKGIYWVGAIDWEIRNFHGYTTPLGTTYNAYLVIDREIALIDTVKSPFYSEMKKRIAQIIPLEKISYVISNHTEMDHSGSIPLLMEEYPHLTLVTTEKGIKNLTRHYYKQFKTKTVNDGEELSLGKKKLKFVETPMVHWPESMATYLQPDGVLFSMDAFGQHLASFQRFDDQVGWEKIRPEAAKYYANIVMPYGQQVLTTLQKLGDFKMRIIAPSHGLIWRKYLEAIIKSYVNWAQLESRQKALVVYDTMWGTTREMAHLIGESLSKEGVEVKLFPLAASDISLIIKEALDARAVIVGSPTLNNGLFPTVASFLTYFKGLRPTGKIGAAFGSYGWSGEAVRIIKQEMEQARMVVLSEELNIQFRLDEENRKKCQEFGSTIAHKILEQRDKSNSKNHISK